MKTSKVMSFLLFSLSFGLCISMFAGACSGGGGTYSSPTPAPSPTPLTQNSPEPSPSASPIPESELFAIMNRDVNQPRCVHCHAIYATREGILASGAVVPGNPDASTFYTLVRDDVMPKDDPKLNAVDKAKIFVWIASLPR